MEECTICMQLGHKGELITNSCVCMMHGYFKMGNIRAVLYPILHFLCKINFLAMSMACPCRIHAISEHHSVQERIKEKSRDEKKFDHEVRDMSKINDKMEHGWT